MHDDHNIVANSRDNKNVLAYYCENGCESFLLVIHLLYIHWRRKNHCDCKCPRCLSQIWQYSECTHMCLSRNLKAINETHQFVVVLMLLWCLVQWFHSTSFYSSTSFSAFSYIYERLCIGSATSNLLGNVFFTDKKWV